MVSFTHISLLDKSGTGLHLTTLHILIHVENSKFTTPGRSRSRFNAPLYQIVPIALITMMMTLMTMVIMMVIFKFDQKVEN